MKRFFADTFRWRVGALAGALLAAIASGVAFGYARTRIGRQAPSC
jgi:hypothetical protein